MLLITSGVRARLLVGSQQYMQKGCVDIVLSPLLSMKMVFLYSPDLCTQVMWSTSCTWSLSLA